jgi:hypothetical protein
MMIFCSVLYLDAGRTVRGSAPLSSSSTRCGAFTNYEKSVASSAVKSGLLPHVHILPVTRYCCVISWHWISRTLLLKRNPKPGARVILCGHRRSSLMFWIGSSLSVRRTNRSDESPCPCYFQPTACAALEVQLKSISFFGGHLVHHVCFSGTIGITMKCGHGIYIPATF